MYSPVYHYIHRPEALEHLSLYEFLSHWNIVRKQTSRRRGVRRDDEEIEEERGEDDGAHENSDASSDDGTVDLGDPAVNPELSDASSASDPATVAMDASIQNVEDDRQHSINPDVAEIEDVFGDDLEALLLSALDEQESFPDDDISTPS